LLFVSFTVTTSAWGFPMKTYHVLFGHGGAVSTDLVGLAHVVPTFPPGQYEVFETMSTPGSATRLWGVAIKRNYGTVELRPITE
jgi:hypothetical protein